MPQTPDAAAPAATKTVTHPFQGYHTFSPYPAKSCAVPALHADFILVVEAPEITLEHGSSITGFIKNGCSIIAKGQGGDVTKIEVLQHKSEYIKAPCDVVVLNDNQDSIFKPAQDFALITITNVEGEPTITEMTTDEIIAACKELIMTSRDKSFYTSCAKFGVFAQARTQCLEKFKGFIDPELITAKLIADGFDLSKGFDQFIQDNATVFTGAHGRIGSFDHTLNLAAAGGVNPHEPGQDERGLEGEDLQGEGFKP